MSTSKGALFRQKAVAHYEQSWEKVILPRFVAPPVFLFLWILLGLALITTAITWLERVPTYTTGSGIIFQSDATTQAQQSATAVIFLPATSSSAIKVGVPAVIQLGATNAKLTTRVVSVDAQVQSPDALRQKYGLTSGVQAALIKQPSIVVLVHLDTSYATNQYAGSILTAQIQQGSQRILSFLPGIGLWIGA